MGKSVDPSRAITEEEPWAIAQQAGKGLSNMRHKDQYGNEITEPDRSNPTRHRHERPLDTIRAFERAIYNDDREFFPRRSNRYGSTYEPQNSQRASMAYQYGDQSARHSIYDNASTFSQRPAQPQRNSTYENYANGKPAPQRGDPSDSYSGTNSNGAASGWSGDPYSTNPSSDASAFANYDQQQPQQYGQSSRLPLGTSDKPLPNVNRLSGNPPMNHQNGYPPYQQQQNGYGQQQQNLSYNGNSQFAQSQSQYRQSYGQQQQQPAWNSQPAATKNLAPAPSTASGKGEKRKSWFRRSKS